MRSPNDEIVPQSGRAAWRFIVSSATATAVILMAALGLNGQASASAPMATNPGPGFYRLMVGDIQLTALSDGTVPLPVGKVLMHIEPAALRAALSRNFLKDPVDTSFNTYLINTGSKLVLVDAGAGTTMGGAAGRLRDNVKAAGYAPEQIDEIYITHMHSDHVGGLVIGGTRAFLNAIVRVNVHETDQWLNPANRDAAPAESQRVFRVAQDSIGPYLAAGRFKPFNGETQLLPEIRAIPSPGHTKGHTGYMIESKGERLLVWGDIVHLAAVQFAAPAVSLVFDSDFAQAQKQRSNAFDAAAAQRYWIAGSHLPFPGIGHVRAEGAGYVWVPVIPPL